MQNLAMAFHLFQSFDDDLAGVISPNISPKCLNAFLPREKEDLNLSRASSVPLCPMCPEAEAWPQPPPNPVWGCRSFRGKVGLCVTQGTICA